MSKDIIISKTAKKYADSLVNENQVGSKLVEVAIQEAINEATSTHLAAVRLLVETVDDFMPNIGQCVLQDYSRLNQGLIQGRRLLEEGGEEVPE